MKKILGRIINGIKGFFNRMADQQAERVIKYYSQIFETGPDEGGADRKIKTSRRRDRKLCGSN